jgi:hypothetical protein
MHLLTLAWGLVPPVNDRIIDEDIRDQFVGAWRSAWVEELGFEA